MTGCNRGRNLYRLSVVGRQSSVVHRWLVVPFVLTEQVIFIVARREPPFGLALLAQTGCLGIRD